jgi:hypothetical protein
MAVKEILDLVTSTSLNPTDWFHVKQGSTDVKMAIGDILNSHIVSANPHNVTKTQVGLANVLNVVQLDRSLNLSDLLNKATARTNLDVYSKSEVGTQIANHANLSNNPHGVTKAQVGLGSVANYATTDNPRENTSTKYASGKAVAILAGELDALIANQTPKGAIMSWSPLTGAIPTGWAVCNGQTIGGIVTPNLIGKFIKYTEVTDAGVSSGSNTVSHTHSGSVAGHALTIAELPPHTHPMGYEAGVSRGSPDGPSGLVPITASSTKDSGFTGSAVPHTHPLSVDTTNIDITPLNYTLVPIIKYV